MYPKFEESVTKAWGEVLTELERTTGEIAQQGSQVSSVLS